LAKPVVYLNIIKKQNNHVKPAHSEYCFKDTFYTFANNRLLLNRQQQLTGNSNSSLSSGSFTTPLYRNTFGYRLRHVLHGMCHPIFRIFQFPLGAQLWQSSGKLWQQGAEASHSTAVVWQWSAQLWQSTANASQQGAVLRQSTAELSPSTADCQHSTANAWESIN